MDTDSRSETAPADPAATASRQAGDNNPDSRATAMIKRLGIWTPALATVALLTYAVHGGMSALHVLTATAVVLVTQLLPGTLAWRAVRPRKGWLLEDLAMGFAVGSVLAIGAQVVAGITGLPWISYSPLLVAIVLVVVPGTRTRILTARTSSMPWWWGPSVAGLFLVTIPQLRSYFRYVPLSWQSGARAPHVDAYLHLALAAQLAHRGPTTFPWVQSESLAYHWFSHAWVAQVSVASGAGLDEVLFRFMPVLMPVVVILAVAVAGVRLTGRYWAGPVAGVLALVGGDLNVFGHQPDGTPIAPLSPSLALAAPMLVGIVLIMALRWNGTMRRGGIFLLPILCIGAAGTKGSTLPLIVTGLGLALVAMLVFNRTRAWHVLADLVIVIACLIFALVVVFHGSDAGLHVSPSDAATQTAATGWLGTPTTRFEMALILAISVAGVLARAAAGIALPFSRIGRQNPTAWLLIGASLAGAGAVAVFAHPGWSQWYFARSDIPILALVSVVGLAAILEVIEPGKKVRIIASGLLAGPVLLWAAPVLLGPLTKGAWLRAVAMIAISGVVLAVAGLIGWLAGATRTERWRLAGAVMVFTVLSAGVVIAGNALLQPPIKALPEVSNNASLAVSVGQIDAARWIRDHSGVNDLVMTNRHCTTPVAPVNCDSRRFVVAAFSERQVLVEGWTATPMSAKLGPRGRDSITVSYWKPALLALNDGFIAAPTATAAQQLRDLGVKWIYVDHTRPYATTLEPYATLRYQAPGVDVYEFTGSN